MNSKDSNQLSDFSKPLSELAVADIHMDGVYFGRAAVFDDQRVKLPAGNFAYCLMVESGELTLKVEFPDAKTINLLPGHVVGLSGLTPHFFSSSNATSDPVTDLFITAMDQSAPESTGADLIVGVLPQETVALSNMLLGPVHLSAEQTPIAHRRIWKAVGLLTDEYSEPSEGGRRALIVRRIAELMLMNITRSLSEHDTVAEGIPALANASTNILISIQSFLERPFYRWTVEQLAQLAGMSRTKYSEEFRKATGQTPIQTLSRIRLTMIARRMQTEGLSVEQAAFECGYGSAAAFVRAFRSVFSTTPAKWLRSEPLDG